MFYASLQYLIDRKKRGTFWNAQEFLWGVWGVVGELGSLHLSRCNELSRCAPLKGFTFYLFYLKEGGWGLKGKQWEVLQPPQLLPTRFKGVSICFQDLNQTPLRQLFYSLSICFHLKHKNNSCIHSEKQWNLKFNENIWKDIWCF